ncbi:MAG TPA: HAD family hydrolase [Gemmatimonadales bacterium]|nr:HAD family hydrolase [Gemmatimonadales bacterium]
MKRLVVFDLDDTLYLERDYVRSGLREVGRKLGKRAFLKTAWRLFEAGERKRIIDRALEEIGVTPSLKLIRSLVARYRSHIPRVRLCPDARRFLARPPEGVAIAVITDGRVRTQGAKLKALGIDRLATRIVITGRWGIRYAKPHPRAFRWMERTFKLPGTACTYVGDNPAKDFQAPRAMGWRVIRMRRPGGLYASAVSRGVPIVRSCDQLRAKITTA